VEQQFLVRILSLSIEHAQTSHLFTVQNAPQVRIISRTRLETTPMSSTKVPMASRQCPTRFVVAHHVVHCTSTAKTHRRALLVVQIRRIFYIVDGREVDPPANPAVIQHIRKSSAIVYSMGSLYTSIIPLLLCRGVRMEIAAHKGASFIEHY